jgi:polysaccharide biosynthesis protein PslG
VDIALMRWQNYFNSTWVWIRRYWLWGVRILLFWAIITSLAPPRPRALLGEPQTVITEKDHVCVHTRLIDEVEEWVIQRSLELVREMGAGTIVEFFPWAYFENSQGNYNWSQADRIIRHAENQGLRVIVRVGFVPRWARPDFEDDVTTMNYLPDESFDEFAQFVAAFAARYAGTVDHIIIWNEPNLAFEWGYRQVNPEDYVRLLQTVYEPVKTANPDVTILAGALAPTLEPEGSPNGLSDLLYLERMYQAGAANYFDALAIHTYGFTLPPDDEPAPDVLNFRRAELLHEIMLQYDDPDTPVFITETGWNDHPRWTKAVRPAQRVGYTVNAFRWAEENWSWVDEMCIWAFRYPIPTFSYPDNFTMVTTDFQLLPIYHAVQAYALGEERTGQLWLDPPTEP